LRLPFVFLMGTCSLTSKILADPTDNEAQIAQTEFSILMDQNGMICGQSKQGGEAVDLSVIQKASRLAQSRALELYSLVNK
jgi:exosome complex RNA-binding protein Rrp42 (RNase PH superfamily)